METSKIFSISEILLKESAESTNWQLNWSSCFGVCPSKALAVSLKDVPPGRSHCAAVPIVAGAQACPADGEEAAVCTRRVQLGPRPPGGAQHGHQ